MIQTGEPVETVNFKIASIFVSEHKDYNLLVRVNYESQSECVIGGEVGSGFIFPIRSIAVILIYCPAKNKPSLQQIRFTSK